MHSFLVFLPIKVVSSTNTCVERSSYGSLNPISVSIGSTFDFFFLSFFFLVGCVAEMKEMIVVEKRRRLEFIVGLLITREVDLGSLGFIGINVVYRLAHLWWKRDVGCHL